MNWTPIIVTVLICGTVVSISDRIHAVARIWLEGLRTEWDIERMRHGYPPRGGKK